MSSASFCCPVCVLTFELSEPGMKCPSCESARLRLLLNTPEILDFGKAVQLEAAHQRERWGADGDAGKGDADWFWLIGYLAGKALGTDAKDAESRDKKLHRIVTVAAAACNWHAAKLGKTNMRPGIAVPTPSEPPAGSPRATGQQETLATWAVCPRCKDRVMTKLEAGPPWNGKMVFVAHAAKGTSPRSHCRESGQPPAGSTAETFGKWKPDREHCPGCAKVARHPGEGYACAWHDAIPAAGLDTPAGSTKGVPEAPCPTCRGSREVLSFYSRGPGDSPGNAMVACPTCRAAVAGVPEGKPAGTFVSQVCEKCNDTGWVSVNTGYFGARPARCPVGCPDEDECPGRTPPGEGR